MAKSTKTTTEEIIEKRDSTPVESSSLFLTTLALLGAIVFCLIEVVSYREDLSPNEAKAASAAKVVFQDDQLRIKGRVERILRGETTEPDDEDMEEEEPDEDEEDAEDDADADADDADADLGEEDADADEEDADADFDEEDADADFDEDEGA